MLADLPHWLLYLIAGTLGGILGSFANVCIIRMPKEESVIWPPSHCPSCDRRLSWWENIPVVSFLLLWGHCRSCKVRISLQYPLVEAFCILMALFTWWHFQEPVRFLTYFCLLIVPLVIVSVIDLYNFIIPDVISLPGIVIGFLVHVLVEGRTDFVPTMIDSVAGIMVGGGSLYLVALAYEKLKKQEGLGGGDVKLIAMLGAFFGWKAVLFILLLSSLCGSIVGLFLIVILRKDLKYVIPFGPFISLAGVVYLFWGVRLLEWYASLF